MVSHEACPLLPYRRGAKEVAVLMRELCDAAESACQDLTSHMEREELQVRGLGCHTP